MQNKLNRRKSRAIAMELLYSGTVNVRSGEITDEFLDDFISVTETTENLDRNYIRNILNIVEGKENYLKAIIGPFLKDWDINRLSRVNLSILKIAVGELLFIDDIPDRVSLNEAIELSKIYSDEESTSFINGVLDKILKAKIQDKIQSESAFTEAQVAPDTIDVLEIPELPTETDMTASAEADLALEPESPDATAVPEADPAEFITEVVPIDTTEVVLEVVVEDIADAKAEDTTEVITEVLTADIFEEVSENPVEDGSKVIIENAAEKATDAPAEAVADKTPETIDDEV